MDEKIYTLTLADGTVLPGLRMNGNNYVSEARIDESLLTGDLGTLRISDGETETVLHHAGLIQQVHYPDNTPPGWYLCFRELPPEERMLAAWETAQKVREVPLSLLPGITAAPGNANICRRGADGLVVVSVAISTEGPGGGAIRAAMLPEGYRPRAAVGSGDVTVHPDGTVWAGGSGAGSVCFYSAQPVVKSSSR